MSLWRQIRQGLRVLTNRQAADQDLSDEVAHYLEESAADFVAGGMTPEEARRAARLQLGNAGSVREQVRTSGWENTVGASLADLRYAARMLRRAPGFTIVAVLTLALGIGANTAIFSAVNAILFEPLPYPHPERLLMIWDTYQGERSEVTFHTYSELAERDRSFQALAVMEPWQPTITGPSEPERLNGQSVSDGFFSALCVAPAIGRDFETPDDAVHGPNVAILSYSLWQREFGGENSVLGRQITLDGDAYTVIGVMPRSFEDVLAPTTEIWSTMHYDPTHIRETTGPEWGHHLHMLVRLRAGVTPQQARNELAVIAGTTVPDFPRVPWATLQHGFIVDSLQDNVTRAVKPALLAILGAVTLVLLIACVNVANLLLARGAQRRGEFAMRIALGAARARLVLQLLTESLLLAILGGAMGLLVAQSGIRALVALSPAELPRASTITANATVFAFAFGITMLIGLGVGLIPALRASRSDPQAGLQQASQRSTAGHQNTRRVLVVAEVALALVLLMSAGLLLRSLERLFAVPPGFDPSNLLTMQVQISSHKYDNQDARRRFYAQALEQVRRTPGVASAALVSLLPLGSDAYSNEAGGRYGAHFENGNGYDVFRYAVTPGYFETMGIALRRGRFLDRSDVANAPLSLVISESIAKKEFAGRDPIGARLHLGPLDRPWYTVVGVVADVKQASLAANESDAAYITPEQSWFADDAMSLVVRAQRDPASLAPYVRKAVWSVDKDQAIVQVATMQDLIAATEAQRRFSLILFEAFGITALALAAIGIYGMLAGSVTERTREIGLRMALGALPGNILALVVRQGITLTAIGIAFGLLGAAAASHALQSLLYGVSRLDPLAYLAVVVLLLLVAALACWIPASRAAKIDPAATLRAE